MEASASDVKTVGDLAHLGYHRLLMLFGGTSVLTESAKDDSAMRQQEFRRQSRLVRSELQGRSCALIDPASLKMQRWDLVTTIGLLFVVFVTPYEVSFVNSTRVDGLFVINQIVNLVFVVDIVITFFLVVEVDRGSRKLKSHSAIARRYLSTWFVVDAISVFPFDMLYVLGAFGPPDSPLVEPKALRAIRILRLIRLVKLLRILRGSRILQRWQDSIGVSSSARTAIFWVAFILTLIHWVTCLWKLVATSVQVAPARSAAVEALVERRMASDSECTGCLSSIAPAERDAAVSAACDLDYCSTRCEIEEAASLRGVSVEYQSAQESWLCRLHESGTVPIDDSSPFPMYLTCLYAAVTMLSGSYLAAPTNSIEYFVISCLNLVGLLLWAMVQGAVCALMTTGNPLETEYKNKLDAINFLIKDMSLPHELRRRMRAYVRSTKDTRKRSGYTNLVKANFSSELQEDIRFSMSGHLLAGSVPFFRQIHEHHTPNARQFFENLSLHVDREAFAPHEAVHQPNRGLFILTQGFAARGGHIFGRHDSFGHDTILSSAALRDSRKVLCLTYIEVAVISRKLLIETLAQPQFQEVRKVVQQAALVRATERTIVMAAMYCEMVTQRKGVLDRQQEMANAERDRLKGLREESPCCSFLRDHSTARRHSSARRPNATGIAGLSRQSTLGGEPAASHKSRWPMSGDRSGPVAGWLGGDHMAMLEQADSEIQKLDADVKRRREHLDLSVKVLNKVKLRPALSRSTSGTSVASSASAFAIDGEEPSEKSPMTILDAVATIFKIIAHNPDIDGQGGDAVEFIEWTELEAFEVKDPQFDEDRMSVMVLADSAPKARIDTNEPLVFTRKNGVFVTGERDKILVTERQLGRGTNGLMRKTDTHTIFSANKVPWSDLHVGDRVFMQNPKFYDGTQLRQGPEADSEFNGQFVENDEEVEILELSANGVFAKVQTQNSNDGQQKEGWVRVQNLSKTRRKKGLADEAFFKAPQAEIERPQEFRPQLRARQRRGSYYTYTPPPAATPQTRSEVPALTAAEGLGSAQPERGSGISDASCSQASCSRNPCQQQVSWDSSMVHVRV